MESKDPPFAYYVDVDCPDRHITEAIHALMREHLGDGDGERAASDEQYSDAAKEKAARIRWLIGVNPNTPAAILEDLVESAPSALLERIAENPNSSLVTLARLAFDPSAEVRAAVAENGNTPIEIICMLVYDESPDVRYKLAESYHLPVDVLQELADDENPFVAYRARQTLNRIETSSQGDDLQPFKSLAWGRRVYHPAG